MEHKIGETFEFNGKKIKCVPSIESDAICEICALNHTELCTMENNCTPVSREDKTDVYFIEFKEENNMPPRKLNNNDDIIKAKQIATNATFNSDYPYDEYSVKYGAEEMAKYKNEQFNKVCFGFRKVLEYIEISKEKIDELIEMMKKDYLT